MYIKYLFIGGPWNMRTEPTDGSYMQYVSQPAPLNIADWTKLAENEYDYLIPEDIKHTYYLKKINLFGEVRGVYVYQDGAVEPDFTYLGQLLGNLFDMYVEE